MFRTFPALALAVALFVSGCNLPVFPGSPVIFLAPAVGESAEDFETRVRQAFSLAQPGSAFEFGAGTFTFTRGIVITASHITVVGQGHADTILDFSTANASEAILASGDEFLIRDIGIFDPPGDGVKTVGSDGVTMQRVSIIWPNEVDPTNGPYGLYPVLSRNILIEGCYVKGAEDAGIYVGQSENIIVRNNWAEMNVAGIEIENSINADVHWNVATQNTAGILVFDLPGLSQAGHSVRVHNNWSFDNNTENFGSGIVGLVPPGTGMLILSTDGVEIFDNEIYGNLTAGIAIFSYEISLLPYPEDFDAFPERIEVYGNHLDDNGLVPQGLIGQVIAFQFGAGQPIPDIIYDRNMNPDLVQPDGELPDDLKICIGDNGEATFGTLAVPPSGDRFDTSLYDCDHPALTDVALRDRLPLPEGAVELSPEETAALCGASPAGVNWPAFEANCPVLSDYNLFVGNDPRGVPVERGVGYDLTTPLFSDFTLKDRYAFVPPGEAAAYDASAVMDFPVGTIITKTFTFDTPGGEDVIETRLLIRREFGWKALVYLWDETGTEATLTPEGAIVNVTFNHPAGGTQNIDYEVPDVNQCAGCHAGVDEPMDLIGPKARWLNKPVPFDASGTNQLDYWSVNGLLTGAPDPALAPRLPVWDDPLDGTVAERARAYLEMNCAHCHRDGGRAGFTSLWLNADEPDGMMTGICKTPIASGVGSLEYDVVPGDPAASILVFRMDSVVPSVKMPELAKVTIHDEGVSLVSDWVTGLTGTCP